MAVYSQDVVDAADPHSLGGRQIPSAGSGWTRSCIARMTSALPTSWSAMCCRGPTATSSVMPQAVTVETLAIFCTSRILHTRAAASRSFTL